MKKLLLSAMAVAALFGATAQNQITPVDGPATITSYKKYIPRFMTHGNTPYLQVYRETDGQNVYDSCFLFDNNLQVAKVLPYILGTYSFTNAYGSVRENNIEPSIIDVYNYDDNTIINGVHYTQTLFNNDSKFEYIKPVWDGECRIVRLDIIDEDGNTVNSITWTAGYVLNPDYYSGEDAVVYSQSGGCKLIVIGGKYYLCLNVGTNNFNKQSLYYRIDRQTQSITRVENVPFNVFPTVAERGNDITVQLEEGASAREIVVVDAMGREVKSIPVAQGQREVKISTSDLGSGMGFVSDRKNGAVKIIVR